MPNRLFWLSLRFSTTLALLLLLIISVVRFFMPDVVTQALYLETCAVPCPLGLVTGATNYDEARQVLEQHIYVENLIVRNTVMRWEWSSIAPERYRRDIPPTVTFTGDLVNGVRIETFIPLGDIYARLALPTETLLDSTRNTRGVFVAVNDFYDGLRVQIFVDCPANRASMLRQPVTLTWFARDAEDFITESSFAIQNATPRDVCAGSF